MRSPDLGTGIRIELCQQAGIEAPRKTPLMILRRAVPKQLSRAWTANFNDMGFAVFQPAEGAVQVCEVEGDVEVGERGQWGGGAEAGLPSTGVERAAGGHPRAGIGEEAGEVSGPTSVDSEGLGVHGAGIRITDGLVGGRGTGEGGRGRWPPTAKGP